MSRDTEKALSNLEIAWLRLNAARESLDDRTGMTAVHLSMSQDSIMQAMDSLEDQLLKEAGTSREQIAREAGEGQPWPVSVEVLRDADGYPTGHRFVPTEQVRGADRPADE